MDRETLRATVDAATAALVDVRQAFEQLEGERYGEPGTVGADLEAALESYDRVTRELDDENLEWLEGLRVKLEGRGVGRVVWCECGAWDGEDLWTVRLADGRLVQECAGNCEVLDLDVHGEVLPPERREGRPGFSVAISPANIARLARWAEREGGDIRFRLLGRADHEWATYKAGRWTIRGERIVSLVGGACFHWLEIAELRTV